MRIRSFSPHAGIEQPVDWDAVEDAECKAELERDRRYVEGLI